MKITKLTTYRLPPRWMFLKIETDEGVVGWGEPVIEGRARTVEAAVHEPGRIPDWPGSGAHQRPVAGDVPRGLLPRGADSDERHRRY